MAWPQFMWHGLVKCGMVSVGVAWVEWVCVASVGVAWPQCVWNGFSECVYYSEGVGCPTGMASVGVDKFQWVFVTQRVCGMASEHDMASVGLVWLSRCSMACVGVEWSRGVFPGFNVG